jgi:plasmid maintenance system antidote protein VapI
VHLKEYIKSKGIIKKHMAKKLKMNIQTLQKIINGYDLSISLADKISRETDGCVTLEDTLKWVKKNQKQIDEKDERK